MVAVASAELPRMQTGGRVIVEHASTISVSPVRAFSVYTTAGAKWDTVWLQIWHKIDNYHYVLAWQKKLIQQDLRWAADIVREFVDNYFINLGSVEFNNKDFFNIYVRLSSTKLF